MRPIQFNENHIAVIQSWLANEINEQNPPTPEQIRYWDEVEEESIKRAAEYGEDYIIHNELYNTDTILWIWLEYVEQEKNNRSFDGMLMERVKIRD